MQTRTRCKKRKRELKGACLKTTNRPLSYFLGPVRPSREKPPLTATAGITKNDVCIKTD